MNIYIDLRKVSFYSKLALQFQYFVWPNRPKINSNNLSTVNRPIHFVPKHLPCSEKSLKQIQEFIDDNSNLFILTGAGISTESGIPDYRSEGVGLYATSDRRPVLYKDFLKSHLARKSYWARNFVGWPRFSSFYPNLTHRVIADWENNGKVQCVVTQNVDRLHHKAGSKNVIELHGSAFEVICLQCSQKISRDKFQDDLMSYNDHFTVQPGIIKPDGDVELTKDEIENFHIPDCEHCGGILKPFIVFFGDSVPLERVQNIKEELANCDALLALGTSLSVYSAFRYILQAVDLKIPIGIVNIGETRGDVHALLKVSARCGDVFSQITVPGIPSTKEKDRS